MPIGGDDDTLAHPSLPHARAGGIDESELVAGRYRIVRWLGAGGMGRVYEALDTELDERVALKVLRGGLSDERSSGFAARARPRHRHRTVGARVGDQLVEVLGRDRRRPALARDPRRGLAPRRPDARGVPRRRGLAT